MKSLILCLSVFILCGCCGLKEAAKGVAGISTRSLEEARPSAVSQQFNYGYDECYKRSVQALEKAGSYIYAKKQGMIALYLSSDDTTPVGVFFKAVDNSNTEVSVSSPSEYAKELLSKILFRGLDRMLHPEKYPKEPEGDKKE